MLESKPRKLSMEFAIDIIELEPGLKMVEDRSTSKSLGFLFF